MRTYSRADWRASNEAWRDFDPLVWVENGRRPLGLVEPA